MGLIPHEVLIMPAHCRVVLVAHDLSALASVEPRLRRDGLQCTCRRADNRDAFLACLQEFDPQVVLAGYAGPGPESGLPVGELLQTHKPQIPLIYLTDPAHEAEAAARLTHGVADYVLITNLTRLVPAVRAALSRAQERMAKDQPVKGRQETPILDCGLAERANDGIIIIQDERIAYGNPGFARLVARAQADILGTRFTDYFPPAHIPVVADRYRRRMEAQQVPPIYEAQVEQSNGTLIAVEINAGLIDHQGRPADLVVVRDITERKQAQEALRRGERYFRCLIERATDAIAITDAQANLRYASPSFHRILGYTAAELQDQSGFHLVHPDDLDLARHQFEKLVGSPGSTVTAEFRVRHRDGSWRALEAVGSNLLAEEAIGGMVFNFRDITARRHAEEQIHNLARFPGENPNPVLRVTTDFLLSYGNRAARPLLVQWNSKVGEAVPSILHDMVEHALSTGKTGTTELTVGEHSFSFVVVPIAAAGYVNLYGRDVTARKNAEAEQQQLQAQLIRSQKLEGIGRLAGGIAHDFNNLLTAIRGYADLALQSLSFSHPLHHDVTQIADAAARAAALTRQLLAFSRRQPFRPIILNLNQAVESLAKLLQRLIGEPVALKVNLQPDLWSVNADQGQLEQVIMNLAVNARDAMLQGGTLTVTTTNVRINEFYCHNHSEARPGCFVRLTLQDTGTGMDQDVITHIFEPFFTTKEASKGTGLGLSVVHGIIGQHRGWISVYSEAGHDTMFSVYLPVAEATPGDIHPPVPDTEWLRGRGQKILLVEDESVVRTFTHRTLQEHGYTVVPAENAEQALDMFDDSYQLLFTDVVLPGRSGIELTDMVRARNPELPVILTSGYLNATEHGRPTTLPVPPLLHKPHTVGQLLETVFNALAGTVRAGD